MDKINQLIIQEFPTSQRIRASEVFIDNISIDHDTKQFLINVGFPIVDGLCVRLDMITDTPKRLIEYGLIQEIKNVYSNYICLGIENDSAFCIEEKENSNVLLIGLKNKDVVNYVNSGVKIFAASLALCKKYCREIEEEDRPKIDKDSEWYCADIETLKQKMIELDESVFEYEKNWWNYIIFEIEMGLM